MSRDPVRIRIVAEPDQVFLGLVEQDDRFDVDIQPCRDESELARVIGDAEVVVTRSSIPMTARVIDACPNLRLIVQGTSGDDNIDLDAAAANGVRVITTPGANAHAVAEAVLGAMIVLQRNLPGFTEEMRKGRWDRRDCDSRSEMRSTSVGIVGVGRVGHRVAELLSSLEHLPLGFDPYVSDQELRDRGVEPVASLHELLERCSVLTLHVPLTDETRGMIGREELEMLQEPRIVINTSRGEVLDPALIDWAVREGIVSGAWLDVFPGEPYEETGWSGSNLLLSPHAAGCSREARRKASHTMYEGLCQALDLEPAR